MALSNSAVCCVPILGRVLVLLLAWPALAAVAGETVLQEKPVRIATSSEAAIFPESWRGGVIQASGTALPEADHERVRTLLNRALAKYPAPVLTANLKNLYVLAELRYNGIVTSGTNSLTSVYLKIGRVNDGFTAAHIEGTFHAEFSSILLRNYKSSFDAAAWQAVNPPDFRYLGNGVDAVKQGKAGQVPSDDLHNEGFLVEYSRSTMENDLNGFAKKLFNGDPSLWATAAKYPRIKAKLDLTIAFYQKLDASFTEAFFRSLRTSAR